MARRGDPPRRKEPEPEPFEILGRMDLPADFTKTTLGTAPREKTGMLFDHVRRAAETPAPGHYGLLPERAPGGGRISKTSQLSFLDIEKRRSEQAPPPGSYDVPDPPRSRGRAFSPGVVPSATDIAMKRAAALPGPCDYGLIERPAPNMQQFNRSNAKSDVDWLMHFAAQSPGPGTYSPPPPMTLDQPKGGRFNNAAKPLTQLDWALIRAREIPAPTDLDPPKLPQPKGGRFSTSQGLSELDRIERLGPRTPGPAHYRPTKADQARVVGGTIRVSKAGNWLDHVQRQARRQPSCVHSAPRIFRGQSYSTLVVPATAPGVGFGRTKKQTLAEFGPTSDLGPGEYDPRPVSTAKPGARFGSEERSMLRVRDPELEEQPMPGPGTYTPSPQRRGGDSQRFSLAKPKSYVEWEEYRAKQIPGPNHYDLDKSQVAFGKSGKAAIISVAECPGFLALEQQRAKSVPPPGMYAPGSDFTGQTPGGKWSNASKADAAAVRQLREASLTPGPGGGVAAAALKARANKVKALRRRREAARQARKDADREAIRKAMMVGAAAPAPRPVRQLPRVGSHESMASASSWSSSPRGAGSEQGEEEAERAAAPELPPDASFTLRTVNGRTFCVRGNVRWTAQRLLDETAAAQAKRMQSPAHRMVLVFGSKRLAAGEPLEAQGVAKGSTMEWVDRAFL